MTIIDKKTCLGEILLSLDPNPASLGEETIAQVSGLTGCDDKNIIFKSNECFVATGDLGECKLRSNTCNINISAVKSKYYACIDKDNDGNYNGFGESFAIVQKIKEIPKEENEPVIGLNDKNDKDDKEENIVPSKITGNVIGNFAGVDIDNRLLIILEITLLLILIFLVLIFYRVLSPKKTKSIEDKEDHSDLFEETDLETNDDDDTEEKLVKEAKEADFFDEIEEKRKEIIDKVDKDIEESKKKKN